VHALAGAYSRSPTRQAEESRWVVTVGRDTVRIRDDQNAPELAKLEPLLKVLREIVSVGEQGVPRGGYEYCAKYHAGTIGRASSRD
jgi:hypothetical protein